jgi:hypothetical protein
VKREREGGGGSVDVSMRDSGQVATAARGNGSYLFRLTLHSFDGVQLEKGESEMDDTYSLVMAMPPERTALCSAVAV